MPSSHKLVMFGCQDDQSFLKFCMSLPLHPPAPEHSMFTRLLVIFQHNKPGQPPHGVPQLSPLYEHFSSPHPTPAPADISQKQGKGQGWGSAIEVGARVQAPDF